MSYRISGFGAVGPSGYPTRVVCLYDQHDNPVLNQSKRDSVRYGNIGYPYRVCYKTQDPSNPPPVEISSTAPRCLSIYDIYGDRVCFSPRVPTAPAVSEALTAEAAPLVSMPEAPQAPPVAVETTLVADSPAPVIAPMPAVPSLAPERPAVPSAPTVLEDPAPVFEADSYVPPAEPDKSKNLLLIGGILAVVAIGGGVAVAMSKGKR